MSFVTLTPSYRACKYTLYDQIIYSLDKDIVNKSVQNENFIVSSFSSQKCLLLRKHLYTYIVESKII